MATKRDPNDPPNPIPNFAKLESEEEAFFKSRGAITPERGSDDSPADTPPAEDAESPAPPVEEPPAEREAPQTEPPLDEAAAGDTERPPREVPVGALQSERERRQAAERRALELDRELAQHREYRARIDERLRVINEQNQAAQRYQVPQEPNVEEDPLGHARWERDRLNERLSAMEQQLNATAQGNQANALTQQVSAITQSFAAITPDYFPTVRTLRQELDADLIEGGYLDPTERNFMVNQWTDAIVRKAIQEGKNPAQAVYNIGKRRIGNRAATPAQPAESRTVAGPNNRDRVAGVRRGAAATTSLGRVGARDTSEGITLDKLLEATPEQFARYMSEQPALVASLMGK